MSMPDNSRLPGIARRIAADIGRRRFLQRAGAAGLATLAPHPIRAAAKGRMINDFSGLNPVPVADERQPRSTDEIRKALREWPGAISVGGGRYSMGGQIAAARSLHLDMRTMSQVVRFDPAQRSVRVQAGMTWRSLQDAIDPHDLSVKIMQSYSNFTIGGSVSVNCHGRYVGKGPLVNSIRAIQIVSADGEVYELSRTGESELFGAVVGGYGGLGVITEVELDLDSNTRIERAVQIIGLDRYPSFFSESVLPDREIVFHSGNLSPPDFATLRAVTWRTTDKPVTKPERLVPRDLDYSLEKNVMWALTELPGANRVGEGIVERALLKDSAVVWRNHEASLDAASLEPVTRFFSTYLLQEYFIPVARFFPFAQSMIDTLKTRNVNAVNLSIRHSPPDSLSLMKWASHEVFAFVLFYKQGRSEQAGREVARWTRELIDAALANGGRYYLPYRLDATRAQFEQAYPEARAFSRLKARVDPQSRFRNLLWEKYLSS